MGIPDHLTCFLRNLYAGQELCKFFVIMEKNILSWFLKLKQLESDMEQQTGSSLEKEYIKAVCELSPCLFNL